jgi:hypothetical protein
VSASRWRSWGWRWRWGGAHTSTHLFFRMSAVGCLLEPTCGCGWLCWRRFVTRVLAPFHVHAFARDGRAGVRRPDIVCACGTGCVLRGWPHVWPGKPRNRATCAMARPRDQSSVCPSVQHLNCFARGDDEHTDAVKGVRGQSEPVCATVGGTLVMAMRAWEWLNLHTQQLLSEWNPFARCALCACVRCEVSCSGSMLSCSPPLHPSFRLGHTQGGKGSRGREDQGGQDEGRHGKEGH